MRGESDGVTSLTMGDLEKSDQSHLQKNTVSTGDNAIVTAEHLQYLSGRESNNLVSFTLGELEKSGQDHLLKNMVPKRDSAVNIADHW